MIRIPLINAIDMLLDRSKPVLSCHSRHPARWAVRRRACYVALVTSPPTMKTVDNWRKVAKLLKMLLTQRLQTRSQGRKEFYFIPLS